MAPLRLRLAATISVLGVATLCLALLPSPHPSANAEPARAQTRADARPIFDTHIHYNRDVWFTLPPEAALEVLDRAGVSRALVSSTPDDGTLRLQALAPDRILPVLRPYRNTGDASTWTDDPTVVPYVEDRLTERRYLGIGEFHLYPGQAARAAPRAFAALAAERGIYLHAHADAGPLEELLALRRDVRVLWAHAGMTAGPRTVGDLLDRYPNLWVELALRADVAPNGRLDPAWAALFARHADRFMIGTDTWVPSQWQRLPALMDDVRRWLDQLPPDTADAIATGNADRLFGQP